MRVIAGTLGGRSFDSPRGHRTHPMSDKIRGALFNILGDISGLRVLDAFAGSGALSFEAVSRGAASAVAIDIDLQAHSTIVANIGKLGLNNKVRAFRQNVSSWSKNNDSEEFDIVIADPPYDDIKLAMIITLTSHVRPGGLYVLSWPGNMSAPELPGLAEISRKSYGDAQLCIYRR